MQHQATKIVEESKPFGAIRLKPPPTFKWSSHEQTEGLAVNIISLCCESIVEERVKAYQFTPLALPLHARVIRFGPIYTLTRLQVDALAVRITRYSNPWTCLIV